MKSLIEFSDSQNVLTEEQRQYLEERLLLINNGKKFGQIVFLAGGAGSGKGFAASNFMESEKFKIRDVDEWKRLFLKLNKEKNKYPEISGLDLKKPGDVFKLHKFSEKLGTKNKTLALLLKDLNKDRLPNIMFDITAKNVKSITGVIPLLQAVGYDATSIHLVWVLTKYSVAVRANATRERVVPADVLLKTHEGAADTVYRIIKKQLVSRSLLDGGIYVILNNRENTIFFTGGDTKKTLKSGKAEEGDKRAPRRVKNSRLGGLVPKAKKVAGVIKDFKYLTVKKPGKPVITEKDVQNELHRWVINNIPQTKLTADQF